MKANDLSRRPNAIRVSIITKLREGPTTLENLHEYTKEYLGENIARTRMELSIEEFEHELKDPSFARFVCLTEGGKYHFTKLGERYS